MASRLLRSTNYRQFRLHLSNPWGIVNGNSNSKSRIENFNIVSASAEVLDLRLRVPAPVGCLMRQYSYSNYSGKLFHAPTPSQKNYCLVLVIALFFFLFMLCLPIPIINYFQLNSQATRCHEKQKLFTLWEQEGVRII